ncbi:hypothetical protein KEM52_001053 [Ascosphaera acerosa]|nr:hypothetical protein KEM52_001053 [Ascosphaera acerosa]
MSAPSDPEAVMVIRDVCAGITTLSLPFARWGCVPIGGRATIVTRATVKLRSGSLAVFSPVAYTPSVEAKVGALGSQVRYLVAPDIEHHLFVKAWKDAHPDAKIIGVEGLQEKWASNPQTKGQKVDYIFTPGNKDTMTIQPDFDEEFGYEYVAAHQNRELVFCHRPSHTLIEADLLFNLPPTEQYSKTPDDLQGSPKARMMGKVGTATPGHNIWQQRFLWYGALRDHKAAKPSIAKIAAWDFDRLIPCHGDVIESDAKRVFLDVFRWYLQ